MKFTLEQADLFTIIREHLIDRGIDIAADASHEFITDSQSGAIRVEIDGLDFATLLMQRGPSAPRRQPRQQAPQEEPQFDEPDEPPPALTSWDDPTIPPDPPPPARDKPEQVELQRTTPGRKHRASPRYSIPGEGTPPVPEAPYQDQRVSRDATRVPARPGASPQRPQQRVDAKVLVADSIEKFKDPSDMDDEI